MDADGGGCAAERTCSLATLTSARPRRVVLCTMPLDTCPPSPHPSRRPCIDGRLAHTRTCPLRLHSLASPPRHPFTPIASRRASQWIRRPIPDSDTRPPHDSPVRPRGRGPFQRQTLTTAIPRLILSTLSLSSLISSSSLLHLVPVFSLVANSPRSLLVGERGRKCGDAATHHRTSGPKVNQSGLFLLFTSTTCSLALYLETGYRILSLCGTSTHQFLAHGHNIGNLKIRRISGWTRIWAGPGGILEDIMASEGLRASVFLRPIPQLPTLSLICGFCFTQEVAVDSESDPRCAE
jgi:hypothetical protein